MALQEVDSSACSIGLLYAQTENRMYGPNTITALVETNNEWFATAQESLRKMGCRALYEVVDGSIVMTCDPADCNLTQQQNLDPKR